MKIRPVGDELLLANRRTDSHDEANSRFSQFSGSAYFKMAFEMTSIGMKTYVVVVIFVIIVIINPL